MEIQTHKSLGDLFPEIASVRDREARYSHAVNVCIALSTKMKMLPVVDTDILSLHFTFNFLSF